MTEMLGPIYHAVSGKGLLHLVKLVEIRNLEMLGENGEVWFEGG